MGDVQGGKVMKTFRKPEQSEWKARPEWEKNIGVQIEGNAAAEVVKAPKDGAQKKEGIFADIVKF